MTKRNSGPIAAALVAESSLRSRLKTGIQALQRADRDRIEPSLRASFADSLALDEATKTEDPQGHRWDYLLGYAAASSVVAYEVHPATGGEVAKIVAKKGAALEALRAHLTTGTRVSRWFWVASGKIGFVPFEKAMLALNRAGIRFVGSMLAEKDLKGLDATDASGSKASTSKRGRR